MPQLRQPLEQPLLVHTLSSQLLLQGSSASTRTPMSRSEGHECIVTRTTEERRRARSEPLLQQRRDRMRARTRRRTAWKHEWTLARYGCAQLRHECAITRHSEHICHIERYKMIRMKASDDTTTTRRWRGGEEGIGR